MGNSLAAYLSSLGLALGTGALASLSVMVSPARADYSIAYCDGAAYAVNIYRAGDPEAPGSALTMRIYSRRDRVIFLNTEAKREPNPEGYNYSNLRGEARWELFVPNSGSTCTLSRDGRVVDTGNVTMREPPSQNN
ncbi:hypothetical protein [Leptolyngbya sp. KIOST-1]|uniref:hypothetical protein n=1 Tax=Leptolyngbya sp. KIOST-1 TaxID=1229172 RepID=UPI0012E0A0DA|nr:hypothetical protein [Leptolyngbya sp. KIOST-1]